MTKPKISFDVRQVSRGYWTYDLYFEDEGWRTEHSVGECFSRRDAEKSARRAVRDEQAKGERVGRAA